MTKLTVVTALYDIGRESLEGDFGRSFDLYKDWFSQLLKTLDSPMIVYCDPSLARWIKEQRGSKEILLNIKPVEQLHDFRYYGKVQTIRNNPVWYTGAHWLMGSPQRQLPFYNPLVMSKQYWLNDVVTYNVYNSDYFIWLDAGVANTCDMSLFEGDFEGRLIPYLDKMLYLAFSYRSGEVHGFRQGAMDKYAGQETDRVVRATLFGGPGEYIKQITPIYDHLLSETLTDGYMGTEENILTLISYLAPDMINLHMVENGFIRHFLQRLLDER